MVIFIRRNRLVMRWFIEDRATRQLAKRQITWLRGWHDVHWLDSEDFEQSLNTVLQVVSA